MKRLLKKQYEILEILGRGGMGCVCKVADRRHGGAVLAIKELRLGTLPPEKAAESLTLFRTEARILLRLTHPNLPRVHDYFSIQGSHFIVMEFIDGRTLDHILDARRGRPVDERLALSWALQICRAMHFLSVQKPRPIVFRDLKPSNIMITRDGRIKLIDFGIARYFKEDKREDTFVYGTPGYAAPEQYGLGQTDARSDIFSLGATLHHCLTGRDPSETPLAFQDVRQLNPKISRETAEVVKKAMEGDMDKRFQSALEMKLAIQKIVLASAEQAKGGKRIIYARPGKPIRLPWWEKTSWVSVPVMTLGCSATTGTLSTDDRWIKPKPGTFGADAARLLFCVENRMLRFGQEYRPHITVKTGDGILQPQLVLKKPWPWVLVGASAIGGLIAAAVLLR